MVSIGGVNIVEALVQAEQRIRVLEKIVEALINAKPNTIRPLRIDPNALRREAVAELQQKYPELGIGQSRD